MVGRWDCYCKDTPARSRKFSKALEKKGRSLSKQPPVPMLEMPFTVRALVERSLASCYKGSIPG
jgi:hypothetical protein